MLDEVMRHCHVASMGNFQVTAIHHPLHLRLNISYILKLRRCASFCKRQIKANILRTNAMAKTDEIILCLMGYTSE